MQAQSIRPSLDQLRKQLAAALCEYQYLDTHVRTLCEGLQGWPLGPHDPCGACAGYSSRSGAIHTLQFDYCFKLPLLNWRNYDLFYPAPPNRRLFAGNSDVQQFEAAAQGYLQAPGTGGCLLLKLPESPS